MIGGCNLQFWSLAAPAYSAVMSVLELTWCIQILFTTNSASDKNHWHPWIFIEKLPDSQAVLRFTMICFVLHILWLLSSLILIFQLKTPKHWTSFFWLGATSLVTLWSTATSIYFLVRLSDLQHFNEARKKILHNSYLVLLLVFSGGFLFLFSNIILLVYLGKRWMNSCIFCPQTEDSRGFYNPLSSRTSACRDYGDSSPGIQMDDVIFDAREFRVNKIFHINDAHLSKVYAK